MINRLSLLEKAKKINNTDLNMIYSEKDKSIEVYFKDELIAQGIGSKKYLTFYGDTISGGIVKLKNASLIVVR